MTSPPVHKNQNAPTNKTNPSPYPQTTFSSTRLYIGGFPPNTPNSEIQEFCSRFGKVVTVDIIPGKRRFGFVTFANHDAAALAVYGLKNHELFRGIYQLEVDWAIEKKKKEDETDKNGVDGQTKGGSAKRAEVEGEGGGKGLTGPRYIPGSEPEQHEKVTPPIRHQTKTNGTATKHAPSQSTPVFVQPTPEPGTKKYAEDFPDLEITIKDSANHDLKYQFRVKSLKALQEFLISEGEGVDPSQLLLSSAPQKDKTQLSYSGIPVVHVYADLLGKEVFESRDNANQREKNLQDMRKIKGYHLPKPKVALLDVHLPSAEFVQLLTQKGYQQVYLNLDSSMGPLAPLHPSWIPNPNTYAYRKGNAIVYFKVQDTWVSSCELLQTTNSTYKDMLPILLKYGICIFNVLKQAFIAPEQLQ